MEHDHTPIWNTGGRELKWSESNDGFLMLGLYCSLCGKWLRWVKQNEFWLERAPVKPYSGDPLKAW